MIYNQLSEYLLKHLAQVQTLMMMSAGSEDAGFRSITRKSQLLFYLLGMNRDTTQITKHRANERYYDEWCFFLRMMLASLSVLSFCGRI